MKNVRGKRNPYHLWTEDEVNFVKENMGKMTTAKIAEAIGVSEKSIYKKTERIRASLKTAKLTRSEINKQNREGTRWTQDQVNYLIDNYDKENVKNLSKKLGKTTGSVSGKLWYLKKQGKLNQKQLELDFSKGRGIPHIRWTKAEMKYLKNNINDKSIKEMSEYLGRGENSIKSKLNRMKLAKAYPLKNVQIKKTLKKNENLTKVNVKNISLAISILLNIVIISAFMYFVFIKFVL